MLFSSEFDAREPSVAILISDVLVAAFLLVAGAPFALLYALALRLSGSGSLILREPSAGLGGRPFTSLRFRVGDSGFLASLARRLHLTEWPQLWNVVTRRMSMVGPRPYSLAMARELASLLPLTEFRVNTRPGITGWAELNLRQNEMADAIAETEYDLYYIRNQSASLYTYILLHGLRSPA
jgi:lipopolysaccharide/colanic/teichoic acid biosynthesis glycosyltransferase